jgi:hypothetical protein
MKLELLVNTTPVEYAIRFVLHMQRTIDKGEER